MTTESFHDDIIFKNTLCASFLIQFSTRIFSRGVVGSAAITDFEITQIWQLLGVLLLPYQSTVKPGKTFSRAGWFVAG